MRKEPRLHFTDEERADPALEKPIRKADRAAAKADKAQAKISKKQVRQKTVDPKTGKVTTKLVLEDKKKPPSKLSHAVRDAPGDAALGKLHKEIRETEQDNVGVELSLIHILLPRLRRAHEENQSRREKAETKAEMSRFRAFQTQMCIRDSYNRKANTSSANTIGNDTGRTSRGIECYPAGTIELGERC